MQRGFFALVVVALLAGCASGEKVTDLRNGNTGLLSYPSSVDNITLRGHLILPQNAAGRVPAMVVAHGSGGPGRREDEWSRFLAEHGIAAFRVDYFGPRNIHAQSKFQPVPHHDANDALSLLKTHPRIDPERIGIIGFSRGAAIALHAANTEGFAAHVGLYPVCGAVGIYNRVASAPALVLIGGRDELVPVFSCEVLVDSARRLGRQVDLKVYPTAYHAWDGDYSGVFYHVAINRSYRMEPDREITQLSRNDVLRFLRNALRME